MEKPNVCDNCGRRYTDEELKPIRDYSMRVGIGTVAEPTGECPNCGALCFNRLAFDSAQIEPI